MSRSHRLAVGVLCWLASWLTSPLAHAQPSQAAAQRILNRLGATQDTVALNGLYGNLEPATQIAPSLLGVGAQSVSTPGGLQDVSLSVLQSFATFPAKGSGVGIEFSPIQLWEKTSYQPTGRDSLLARLLGIKPLQHDAVAYRSLQEYRRTFWRRGFVLSGASVNDSVAARLAVGISYTFGAGQLDPFKAKGYSEALTQQIQTRLLSQDSVARMQVIADEYYTRRAAAIDAAVAAASIKASQFSPGSAYGDFLNYITDNVLGLPQANSGATTSTQLRQATDSAGLRTKLTSYLSTLAALTPAQRTTFTNSLLRYASVYQNAVNNYQRAARPVLRTVGQVLKASNQDFEKRQWNAPLLQVGGGHVWRSPDHTWNGLRSQSVHVFVRGSLRAPDSLRWLARHAQLVGNLQFVGSPTDSVRRQTWTGLRLLVGNERLRFSLEGSLRFQTYRAYDGVARPDNTINRFTVGIETRMADNLWLEIAFGRTNATATTQPSDRAGLLTLADLKYGFRSKRRFKIPAQ